MERLISMRLFVEKKRCTTISTTDIASVLTDIFKYEMFLRQKLELWMFVPCKLVDGVWVVLEEPTWQIGWEKGKVYSHNLSEKSREYQESKDRVLFSGWELVHNGKWGAEIAKERITGHLQFNITKYKTVERLLMDRDLTLTPTAQKQFLS